MFSNRSFGGFLLVCFVPSSGLATNLVARPEEDPKPTGAKLIEKPF